MLVLMANAGVIQRSADPDAWRRQLALLLDGLAARQATSERLKPFR
jgi:hypothetical protein